MIDGLWCLNLREDNREQNQTLKNETVSQEAAAARGNHQAGIRHV